jgi:hypothetical protein
MKNIAVRISARGNRALRATGMSLGRGREGAPSRINALVRSAEHFGRGAARRAKKLNGINVPNVA